MRDVNAKDKIQIHIVSSVKGGCGKTAFSIFKALELANEMRRNNLKNRMAEVLWLDADFNGTASRKLIYGVDEAEFANLYGKNTIDRLLEEFRGLFDTVPSEGENILCFDRDFVPYTINDYLREDIQSIEKMTVHGYAVEEQKSGGTAGNGTGCVNAIVDFIFSSGRGADRKMFHYGNGLPTVEIGRFTYLMRAMLLKLCELGRTETAASGKEIVTSAYRHIVIDMPPGDDAYASALLETVRKMAEKDSRLELHLYTLTTSDRGHMYAVQENLKSICEQLRSSLHTETVYTVLNEVREDEFGSSSSPNDFSLYMNMIKTCRDGILKEYPGDNLNLKVLFCRFQNEYYQFCRHTDSRKFSFEIDEVR